MNLLAKSTRKIRSYYRRKRHSSSSPDAVPLYWFSDAPNFGDDINPLLFAAICKRPIRFSPIDDDEMRIIGMGSILAKPKGRGVVIGSGLIHPERMLKLSEAHFLSVRGELTAQIMEGQGYKPRFLGDPMIFLDFLFPQRPKITAEVGIVPHHSTPASVRHLAGAGVRWIDPSKDPLEVILSIASCKRIISQSLHGLIVADALDVPNIWWKPSSTMIGGQFKFQDYLSTMDCGKFFLEDITGAASVPENDFSIAKYRFDRAPYLNAISETVKKLNYLSCL